MMLSRLSGSVVLLVVLAALAPVRSAPLNARHEGHDDTTVSTTANNVQKQNGLDAQKLNAKFTSLKATDTCQVGDMACITGSFAQCIAGKWALTPCASGTQCVALPLVNKPGTSLSCDYEKDAVARFEAAGVSGGLTGPSPNESTTETTTTTPTDEDGGDECEDEDEDNSGESDEECEDEDEGSTGNDDEDCEDGESTETNTGPPSSSTSVAKASSTPKGSPHVITVTVTATPTANPNSGASTPIRNVGQETSVNLPASGYGGHLGYKRQISASNLPDSTPTPTVVATTMTLTVAPTLATTPATSVVAPSVSESTGVEPTSIVIGPDGIRTVTVVSTVTAGCFPSSVSGFSSATIATPSASGVLNIPIFTTVTITPTPIPTLTVSFTTPVMSSSVVLSSSSAPSSSSSEPVISVFSSALPSIATPSAANTVAERSSIAFSFSSAPSPTAAPTAGGVNNNGANPSVDLSVLLTATVG